MRVDVSPRELRVEQTGLLRTSTTIVPTEELEELEVVGAGALQGSRSRPTFGSAQVIVARSDRAMVAFGNGLSPAELKWMRAVIWNVVSA